MRERSHFTSEQSYHRSRWIAGIFSLLGTSFQSCCCYEPCWEGYPQAARPTSFRQAGPGDGWAPDACHSGVLSGRLGNPKGPDLRILGSSYKTQAKTHTTQLPPLGTSVTGRTMLFAHLPEAGLGLTPVQGPSESPSLLGRTETKRLRDVKPLGGTTHAG